jgi:hypothetical protein
MTLDEVIDFLEKAHGRRLKEAQVHKTIYLGIRYEGEAAGLQRALDLLRLLKEKADNETNLQS